MSQWFGTLAMCMIAGFPFALLILLLTDHPYPDLGSAEPGEWWHCSQKYGGRNGKHIDAFRRKAVAATLPPAVVLLAEAFAAGEDCGFALHDALLEAGQLQLAEPFGSPDPLGQLAAVERMLDKG